MSLGSGKAENEEAELGLTFVRSEILNSLAPQDLAKPSTYDVVSGEKGTGKSAIAWALHKEVEHLQGHGGPLLVVDLFREFDHSPNLLRSVFKAASESTKTSAEQVSGFWNALIDVAVGYHLASRNVEHGRGQPAALKKFLSGYGIGSIEMFGVPGMVRAMFEAAVKMSQLTDNPDAYAIYESSAKRIELAGHLHDALVQEGLFAWVIVDRLDDVFTAQQASWENTCLAGFVNALKERSSELSGDGSRVRVKAFVRSDFLLRAGRGSAALSNIELVRTHPIDWSQSLFAEIGIKWLSHSFDPTAPQLNDVFPRGDDEAASDYLGRIFPTMSMSVNRSGLRSSNATMWDWLIVNCRDASGKYNPRYVLWALSGARDLALAEADGAAAVERQGPLRLFDNRLLKQGWIRAGKRALTALYTEAPYLQALFQAGLPKQQASMPQESMRHLVETRSDAPGKVYTSLLDLNIIAEFQGNSGLMVRVAPIFYAPFSIPVEAQK